MTLVRYDTARGPSGGPTPGAVALRDHWRKTTGLGDLGIYNPRAKRGSTGWSVHAEGRAVDLAASAYRSAEKQAADRYCQFLIDNSVQIQCQYLIWNRRSWKSGRGWQGYSGVSPHTDHIHAELNHDGARTVTVAQLDALWAAWTNDHDPEDDDMAPATLVFNHYATFLKRLPENLWVVGEHVKYIEAHGQDEFTGMILNSAEGKKKWPRTEGD